MRYSLIAIFTLGIFSLTPSPAKAMDLKKESGTNNSCVRQFGSKQDNVYWCITSKDRVIAHSLYGYKEDAGKLGGAENKEGKIKQYEIENNKLIVYTCNARNWYVLECSDEVKIRTLR